MIIDTPGTYRDISLDGEGIEIASSGVHIIGFEIANAPADGITADHRLNDPLRDILILEGTITTPQVFGIHIVGNFREVSVVNVSVTGANQSEDVGHGISFNSFAQETFTWEEVLAGKLYKAEMLFLVEGSSTFLTQPVNRFIERSVHEYNNVDFWQQNDAGTDYFYLFDNNPTAKTIIATNEQCKNIIVTGCAVTGTIAQAGGAEGHGIALDDWVSGSLVYGYTCSSNAGKDFTNNGGSSNWFINNTGDLDVLANSKVGIINQSGTVTTHATAELY